MPETLVGAALYSDGKKNVAKSNFVMVRNGYLVLAADVRKDEKFGVVK